MDRKHPLGTLYPKLWTPDYERLESAVRVGILSNSTSVVVSGKPRIGKSSAKKLIEERLDVIAGEPAVMIYLKWDNVTKTEVKLFHRFLLSQIGHKYRSATGDYLDYRDKFVRAVEIQCIEKDADLVVFVIDDAHLVKPIEFDWMHAIYNYIIEAGLRMFSILIGQPKLTETIRMLKAENRDEIIGRFMRNSFSFHGLRSEQELFSVLAWFDERSEYPAGSGQPYPATIVSQAFENNFRFQQLSPSIWKAYTNKLDLAVQELPAGNGMSMAIFHSILKLICLELELIDSPDMTVPDGLVESTVNSLVQNLK